MVNENVIKTVKVLEIIKNECEKRDNCHKCPYQGTICFPNGTNSVIPECWNLNTLKYKLLYGGGTDGYQCTNRP